MKKEKKELLPLIKSEREELNNLRRNLIFILDAFEQREDIEDLAQNYETQPNFNALIQRFSFLDTFEAFDENISYESLLEALKDIRENKILIVEDASLINEMINKKIDKELLNYNYCALQVSLKETKRIIEILNKFEKLIENQGE